MAYDKKKLEKQALEAIKAHNIMFIKDLAAYLPVSRQTIYDKGLDKVDTIKDSLEQNRIRTKEDLKSKWYKSPNATLQVALMKLIADDDERKKLSQTYTDVTSDNKPLKTALVEFVDPEDVNFEEQDTDS